MQFESFTLSQLKIGDKKEMTFEIKDENVRSFAEATGDFNPIHVNDEYAAETPFGKRVAHGVLLTGIVSGLLGTRFPGLGTVAREMNAKFSGPVFIGDTVTVTAEVTEIKERMNMCSINYSVKNPEGKTVVKGTAVVLPKKE